MTESNGAVGVLAAVQRDHREIEQLLTNVEIMTGNARRDAFEELVRKLAVHEAAEEEVVHPLTKEVGADAIANTVLSEEDAAKRALAALDGVDVKSADFDSRFALLSEEVKRHAQREEREEHPKIMEREPRDKLERLERVFEIAEKTAPTRPHANAPESMVGNLMIGPILAITDRVRDAVRDAQRKMQKD